MNQSAADAHNAATTREAAAAARRNAAVREALDYIHAGDKARALDVMRVSVHAQCWLEGLA